MKEALDRFSNQSRAYKLFRPTYPQGLYRELLQYVGSKETCWDCGTGNGQVALALAPHFRSVYASDISKRQIENAEHRENISFSVERAENTSFGTDQFNLITVAQAIHWFDLEAFGREVGRVSKEGCILAVWGYGLLRITKSVDKRIDYFYSDVVGSYWDKERGHIDNEYIAIDFNFEPIVLKSNWSMTAVWSLEQLQGYLNTWSSVQHYKNQNSGENPVDHFVQEIEPFWGKDERKLVKFPVFRKFWRVS